jgi:hypothetical protein
MLCHHSGRSTVGCCILLRKRRFYNLSLLGGRMILAQLVGCFGDRGWLGGSVLGAKMRTGCPWSWGWKMRTECLRSWGLEQGGVVAFF